MNLRYEVFEEGLESDLHFVIVEMLSEPILQEIWKSSELGLDLVLVLALVDFLSIQNLLLLLDEDATALIEEAPAPIHQELAHELKVDVFVVPKVLGKHLFQNPPDHCRVIYIILEFNFSISQNQVNMNLKGGNHERCCDIRLQVSLGVSIAQGKLAEFVGQYLDFFEEVIRRFEDLADLVSSLLLQIVVEF